MRLLYFITFYWAFPRSLDGKGSAFNAGDPGSIPGSGRSPGKGDSYPLQYFCLAAGCAQEEPGPGETNFARAAEPQGSGYRRSCELKKLYLLSCGNLLC